MEREWKQKEGQKKRSASLLRQTESRDRENRPGITGYKPLKEQEPSVRETLRLENSYGVLAIGGDERKRMTLVASGKRATKEQWMGRRERRLEEQGRRDRPLDQNRTMANPGKREEGAFGFQFRPSFTHTQMLARIKGYMDRNPQKLLKQMLPFLETKQDLREKNRLEQEISQARKEGGGENPRQLDALLQEKKQELVWKRQGESRFGQRLEKAAREEKKTVWPLRERLPVRLEKAALEEQEDAQKPENEEDPKEK